MNLSEKVILITGAGSGLGAATAEWFFKQGAKIAILDIHREKAEQREKAVDGIAFECDVSDANSAEAAIKKVVNHFGQINACINCAGIAPGARIVGREGPQDLGDFSKVITINLIGTFNMMRLCAHQMLQQKPIDEDGERGVIINTASVAAFEGQIGQAAYSASKGGVVAMTLPAAREFGKLGVRVMAIAPGIMDTPMMSAMSDEVRSSLSQTVTFPKRLGQAEEYARVAQFICENSYLNGSVIRLDGGLRMAAK